MDVTMMDIEPVLLSRPVAYITMPQLEVYQSSTWTMDTEETSDDQEEQDKEKNQKEYLDTDEDGNDKSNYESKEETDLSDSDYGEKSDKEPQYQEMPTDYATELFFFSDDEAASIVEETGSLTKRRKSGRPQRNRFMRTQASDRYHQHYYNMNLCSENIPVVQSFPYRWHILAWDHASKSVFAFKDAIRIIVIDHNRFDDIYKADLASEESFSRSVSWIIRHCLAIGP